MPRRYCREYFGITVIAMYTKSMLNGGLSRAQSLSLCTCKISTSSRHFLPTRLSLLAIFHDARSILEHSELSKLLLVLL